MLRMVLIMSVLAVGSSACSRVPAQQAVDSNQASASQETPKQWQEGVHYKRIEPPQPIETKPNQIVVTEYFWYGCPHCFELEPYLLRWLESKPQDVVLKRVAVGWNMPERIAHAKLFYALEALGRLDLHEDVFAEIHQRKDRLYVQGDEAATLTLQRKFLEAHGINAAAFDAAYMEAASRVSSANDAARAALIPGVPAIVVGRYRTDIGMADGLKNVFLIVDSLIQRERG